MFTSQLMSFLSPLFIAGHSRMNDIRAFNNVIALFYLICQSSVNIGFICIYKLKVVIVKLQSNYMSQDAMLFSYSFTASDGPDESTAGRVVSPYAIKMHLGLTSKEARRARKQIYRLRQTTSHSSLLVARQGDVSRKLNHVLFWLTRSTSILLMMNDQIYIPREMSIIVSILRGKCVKKRIYSMKNAYEGVFTEYFNVLIFSAAFFIFRMEHLHRFCGMQLLFIRFSSPCV